MSEFPNETVPQPLPPSSTNRSFEQADVVFDKTRIGDPFKRQDHDISDISEILEEGDFPTILPGDHPPQTPPPPVAPINPGDVEMPIDPMPKNGQIPALPPPYKLSNGTTSQPLPDDQSWQKNRSFKTNQQSPLSLQFLVERGEVTFILLELNMGKTESVERWKETLGVADGCLIVAKKPPPTEAICKFKELSSNGSGAWTLRTIGGPVGGDFTVKGNVVMRG